MDINIKITLPNKQQAIENIMNKDKQAKAAPGAPTKKTKEEVDYREELSSKFAHIDENCGTCKYGINPEADMQPTCEKVQGTVNKRFVCDEFDRGKT